MATSASTFPSLSVPALDDTMDMSSPANRVLDDDIEIDFDEPPGGDTILTDDEQMIEDTTRPATATDDMMDDDVQQFEASHEEVMQDDGVQPDSGIEQDDEDELIDYGENEEEIAADIEVAVAEEVPNITFEEPLDVHAGEITDNAPEQLASGGDFAEDAPEAPDEVAGLHDPDAAHGLDEPNDTFASEAHSDPELVPAAQEHSPVQQHAEHNQDDGTAEEGDTDGQPLSLNTTYPGTSSGPDTPTDTGLHPMTVRYRDLHIPLFKSKRQLDGLLKNDNLASVSLVDLMSDCRHQLQKRDLDIPDSQSIVLCFDQLGLILSEETSSASATSLNEVLEMYLQLHYNEGWQEIEPLALTISSQLKFSSTFSMLKNAAALGQGISEFSIAHGNSEHELGQSYLEEGDDWYGPAADEHGEYPGDEGYEEAAHEAGTGDPAAEEAYDPTELAHDQHDEDYNAEGEHEDQTENFYYDETEHLDSAADPGEAAEALDVLAEESTNLDQGHEAQPLVVEEGAQAAQPVTTEEHSASTASSQTVQGDQEPGKTTDAGGTNQAPQRTTAGSSIKSDTFEDTLPTEHSTVDAEAATDADHQQTASEDWLNEYANEHGHTQGDYQETYEGEHDDHGQELYRQQVQEGQQEDYANGFDEMQHQDFEQDVDDDGNHPDYQPYEDEDQFHTAHEGFGDSGFYEHGLEHTEYHEDAGETQQAVEEEEIDDTVLIHPQGDAGIQRGNITQQLPRDDFEDEIDFGEDEDTAGEEPPPSLAANPTVSVSPKGKRSFEEIDEADDGSFLEMPEAKKARPS